MEAGWREDPGSFYGSFCASRPLFCDEGSRDREVVSYLA